MADSTEAPASMNFRVMYKGVEVQITNRDIATEVKPFMEKAKIAIDWSLANGYVAIPQKTYGAKKEIEYADYPCPSCGKRVVKETTKAGKKLEKCETQSWDATTKSPKGCAYTKWL